MSRRLVMGVAIVAFATTTDLQLRARNLQQGSLPVFTSQQAQRGKAEYTKHCASCHQTDLGGGHTNPPLAGDAFQSNWSNRTVGDLFERIRSTMPQNDPASLTRTAYLDIVAYVLESNDYPPGERDLEDAAETLNGLRLK